MNTVKSNFNRHFKTGIVFLLIASIVFIGIPTATQAAVHKKNIKKAAITLEYTATDYTGNIIKPKVTVKYGKTRLKKNRDYTLTYKNNKKAGKAQILIKGKGRYTGSVKKYFRIRPKTTQMTSLSALPTSMIVKWKKQRRQTTGYQLQYSPDSKFKSGTKTIMINSNNITKWEIPEVLPNTTYYVRIRTFKRAERKPNYSVWSKKMKIKTKALAVSIDKMAETNAEIATQILRERANNQNMLFSPFSLYEDLAMATNGAKNVTLAELEAYLGGDIETVNNQIASFNQMLPGSVHVANSIWINETYGELNEAFKNTTESQYNARIESVPYNDATVESINAWVKEQTHQMIDKLVNTLTPEEVMHLINAVAFESEWMTPYEREDIREDIFRNNKGKNENCIMLYSVEQTYMDLTASDGSTIAYGFLKPYEDGKTAFLGLLPTQGFNVSDILEQLNGQSYAAMYQNRRAYINGTLYAGIPEFTWDDELDLIPYIQSAGVNEAFDPNFADFSGMMQNETELHIDAIKQKTHIEVDRYGTKAAAATDIGMKANSAFPIYQDLHLILNRPFVYAIVDIETGLPYFMGVQYSVKK